MFRSLKSRTVIKTLLDFTKFYHKKLRVFVAAYSEDFIF